MKLELTPIGLIHSPHREAKGTPIQPAWAQDVEGTVEVFPEFAEGLRDLEGFERVWLLYWLDRARKAGLEVIPYLDTQPRGVFATRAPSRPNPIGLSCVRLLAVEGRVLRVKGLDILAGTPLLDIKPYLPDFDAFAVERIGWYAHARGSGIADDRFAQSESNSSAVAARKASSFDWILAKVCANCPVCRRARRHQRGVAFWLVKHVEARMCPFCRAYERVYGCKAHERGQTGTSSIAVTSP